MAKKSGNFRFPDQWMGDVRLMLIWGAGAFVVSLFMLWLTGTSMAFRIADLAALLLGAAGVFVVVVDATRNVAEWRYDMIRDWDQGPLDRLRQDADLVARITETDGRPIPPEHPDRERLELYCREAPAVHDWALRVAARASDLKTEREHVAGGSPDQPRFVLEGNLAPPRTTEAALTGEAAILTHSARYYVEIRDLQVLWRERASGDTGPRRAVFALAPFALSIGIGIALASTTLRPL